MHDKDKQKDIWNKVFLSLTVAVKPPSAQEYSLSLQLGPACLSTYSGLF